MTKIFDWDTVHGSLARKGWLLTNYKREVTEQEYIDFCLSLPRKDKSGQSNAHRKYKARHDYHYLKDTFGFFTGVTQ